MPPSVNLALLEARRYEAFYELVHSYSEDLLVPAAALKMATDLLARVAERLPDTIASAFMEREKVSTLKSQARELQETVRSCFWPHRAAEIGTGVLTGEAHRLDEALNRERWSPYDQQAWDAFCATVAEQLMPRISALKRLVEALNIPAEFAVYADVDSGIAYVMGFKATAQNYLHNLETLVDED